MGEAKRKRDECNRCLALAEDAALHGDLFECARWVGHAEAALGHGDMQLPPLVLAAQRFVAERCREWDPEVPR